MARTSSALPSGGTKGLGGAHSGRSTGEEANSRGLPRWESVGQDEIATLITETVLSSEASALTDQFRFEFISSYMGERDYRVHGDGEPYRIRERWQANSYERSIFNGGDAEWQRDVVAAIGLIQRGGEPISQAVVDAFSAWRAAKHAKDIDYICAHPERYGNISRDDPLWVAPTVVRGAHYEVGEGWIVNADSSAIRESADLAHACPMDVADPSPR